jgi:hypothetical protein
MLSEARSTPVGANALMRSGLMEMEFMRVAPKTIFVSDYSST